MAYANNSIDLHIGINSIFNGVCNIIMYLGMYVIVVMHVVVVYQHDAKHCALCEYEQHSHVIEIVI